MMLKISTAPHLSTNVNTTSLMRDVVIALLPAVVAAVLIFGLGALKVIVTSVAACVIFEYIISVYLLKRSNSIKDYSAIITGILLAFNLPSNFPIWMILIGSFVAIGISKMAFGGLGKNIFNPALVGRVFLFVSFPTQMTSWPLPSFLNFKDLDVQTGATILGHFKQLNASSSSTALTSSAQTSASAVTSASAQTSATAQTSASAVTSATEMTGESYSEIPNYWDMFIGNMGGCIGEVSALALLLGLAYLLYRKVIRIDIPMYYVGTVFVLTSIMWFFNKQPQFDPISHVLSGGLLLGAIFMATDYVTSPMTKGGKIIFAIGCGLLTFVFRNFGSYPEGVSFAILIMNAFVPLINKSFKPRLFGTRRL